MTCPHKFTKFKQHGIERTYTCELCDMDIDGEVFDYISSLKRDMRDLRNMLNKIIPHLKDARATAMRFTMEARAPECGEFGGIAQNLDWVCGQLDPPQGG